MTEEKIKELADQFLEKSQEYLKADGELPPLLFFEDKNGKMTFTELSGVGSSKHQTFALASGLLAMVGASFAILINDAYYKNFKSKEEADDHTKTYKNGDMSTDLEASEALMCAFKGQHVASCIKQFPYIRNDVGEIVFGEATRWCEGEFNLLPDWWEKDDEQERESGVRREDQNQHDS